MSPVLSLLGYLLAWVLSSVPFLPGIVFKISRYSSVTGWLLWAAGVPVFFAGIWAVAHWTRAGSLGDLGLKHHKGWARNLAWGFAVGAAWVLLDLALRVATGERTITGFSPLPKALLASALLLVNFAFVAVSEELVHRGLLLHYLRRWLPLAWAAPVAAILFALVHIPQQGGAPLYLADLVLMGLLWIETYALTGSLWLGIGMHWAIDAVGWMLLQTDAILVTQNQQGATWIWFYNYAAAVLLMGIFWLLRRRLGPDRPAEATREGAGRSTAGPTA